MKRGVGGGLGGVGRVDCPVCSGGRVVLRLGDRGRYWPGRNKIKIHLTLFSLQYQERLQSTFEVRVLTTTSARRERRDGEACCAEAGPGR